MAKSQTKIRDFPLNGKCITSRDPATIGDNFQTLTNLRYTDSHPKGVRGMSKINTNAPTVKEDYTTYTELDASSRVTVAANTLTLTSADRDEDFYVVKDFGANYFGDVTHWVDVNYTSAVASAVFVCWGLADTADDFNNIEGASGDALYVEATKASGSNYAFRIINLVSGTPAVIDTSSSIAENTESFLSITRSGTTGTVQIYSTAALRLAGGAGDVDTITGTVQNTTFRYVYGIGSYDGSSGGVVISGTCKNLELGPAGTGATSMFHYRKESPAESHVLLQSGSVTKHILDNTTAIPTAGDFAASAILTETSGASTARFSTAPNDNMAMCDQKGSYVWGGNEKRCSAFVTSTAAVVNSVTNPINYTTAVINTLTTADNVAIIGGGDDSNAVVLLHCDGSDGGTTFTNDGEAGNGTAVGTAVTDTAQAKFGVSSMYLDGNSDYVTVSDDHGGNDYFNMSTNKFTVETYAMFNALPTSGNSMYFFSQYDDADNFVSFWITNTSGVYSLNFKVRDTASDTVSFSGNIPVDPVTNRWYHAAVIRGWGGNANDFAMTWDGDQIGDTLTDASGWPDLAGNLEIGRNGAGSSYMNGWLDEFRFSDVARWTAAFTPYSRPYSAAATTWLVGATRPLQGVKFYIGDANGEASTMTVKEWNGASWTTLSVTDNTDTGATLATTGTVTWSSTANTSKIKYLNGSALYWYQFSIDAGSATIYQCTVDAPMQIIKDIWDGVPRSIGSFLIYDNTKTKYRDWTLRVLSSTYDSANEGTYAELDAIATGTEYFVVGFTEQMLGVNFLMHGAKGNETAATTVTPYYWNGAAWSELSGVQDGTSSNSISLAQTGAISWQPPDAGQEYRQELLNNPPLYYYKFTFNQNLSADVILIYVTGIPAQKTIKPHAFPLHAGNSLWLCGEVDGHKNKVIRSLPFTASVWNGSGYTEYYVGDESAVMSGAVIYAQLGSNLYDIIVFCKKNSTHMLVPSEGGLESFEVASNIGCVAPGTMKALNIGTLESGLGKSICMWQGAAGIYLFDGRSPVRISEDIQDIFEKSNTTTGINADAVEVSYGWFDIENYAYHWVYAAGTATVPDTEWVYDIKRHRWFKIDRGTGNDLMCGTEVENTLGVPYVYACDNSGQMYRLENGNDFDGADIVHTLHTGEIPVSGSPMIESKVRRVKLVCGATNTTTNTVNLNIYSDGHSTATTTDTLAPQATSRTIAQPVTGCRSNGFFHSIKLDMTTDNETTGFEPMYLGVEYKDTRLT